MIGLIPMAGTMTSFGAIKTAIQEAKNCTKAPKLETQDKPMNLSVEG